MRAIHLPSDPSTWWLSELEIENVEGHQLEGIKYKVFDYGSMEFEALVRDIEIALCRQSTPDEQEPEPA